MKGGEPMEKQLIQNVVYLDDDKKEYNFEIVTLYAEQEIASRTCKLIDQGRNVRSFNTKASAEEIHKTYKEYGYTYNSNLVW